MIYYGIVNYGGQIKHSNNFPTRSVNGEFIYEIFIWKFCAVFDNINATIFSQHKKVNHYVIFCSKIYRPLKICCSRLQPN